MNAVGFIFARGGSKGLPDKNIRLLAGTPLIGWAIQQAFQVKRLRRVIVSTDSDEIASVARSFGAETPFKRPDYLAKDITPEWLAWRHALVFLEETEGRLPDAMVSIPTTAPLRHSVDIENCLDEFGKGNVDIVVTVTSAHRNPWFNMVITKPDGTVELIMPSSLGVNRRQDTPPVFDLTTVAYVADPKFVLIKDSIFCGRVRAVNIPVERSIDIDSLYDFEIAEFLMTKKKWN